MKKFIIAIAAVVAAGFGFNAAAQRIYYRTTDCTGTTTTTGSNGYRSTSSTDCTGTTTIRIW